MILDNASWITPTEEINCPFFSKSFNLSGEIKKATLYITAKGVYRAEINKKKVGRYVLAPGWTVYEKRHQYQCYDLTELIESENTLEVAVGSGWERSWIRKEILKQPFTPGALICKLVLEYKYGAAEEIISDESWDCFSGNVISSDIYDGEHFDASLTDFVKKKVVQMSADKSNLIYQQGEEIVEHERLKPVSIFTAPNGETVVDFGQNITGYPEITLDAKSGDRVDLSFGEVLDKNGNFYNANYRRAKCEYVYICKDGVQTYKPYFTFYGFRYVRVNSFPGTIKPENITAVAVYSDIKQTGRISCSNEMVNKLFSNIIWGQKDNFLDIPTDCPQRDERLGWTGDAQVFARTACKNFDVQKFFTKWLADLSAEQEENGVLPRMSPNPYVENTISAAWQDAAVIIPWELYLAYGDKSILEKQYDCMCRWIEFIENDTKDEFLWTGRTSHFGDWLGLDAPYGSYKGSSCVDLIASAYYAYITGIMAKVGRVIGKDASEFEELHKNIVKKYKETFTEFKTQTECVLTLYFNLTDEKEKVAAQLNDMIVSKGTQLETGFVGTPYLLHALSDNGYADTAYSLLLREEFPSWLYSVKCGATTIWEHWDGINEKGEMWSTDMNSFNHYAYGAVAEWMYSVPGGIVMDENNPGYKSVIISPVPDKRFDYFTAELDTRRGTIISKWEYNGDDISYYIETPVPATVVINGKTTYVQAGKYKF